MWQIISKSLFTLLISLSCSVSAYKFNAPLAIDAAGEDSTSIIADGAKLQLISNQFSFTEGPAVDKKRKYFFY